MKHWRRSRYAETEGQLSFDFTAAVSQQVAVAAGPEDEMASVPSDFSMTQIRLPFLSSPQRYLPPRMIFVQSLGSSPLSSAVLAQQ